MKITQVVVTIRIPEGKTKNDLATMINNREILAWIPRDFLRLQNPIAETGNAPDEKIVHVTFQDPT